MKEKPLQIMNGRGYKPGTHLYIAAHSKADAVRMLNAVYPLRGWLREVNIYFSLGCWGNSMEGVKVTRGIWEGKDYKKPRRIL